MKPWEETWTADVDPRDLTSSGASVRMGDRDVQLGKECGPPGENWYEATEFDVERARLVAAAPDMARVLLALEWDLGDIEACPSCHAWKPGTNGRPATNTDAHAADCALDAALRKAGVR